MSILELIVGLILGAIAGFYYTCWRLAKDKNWIRLEDGQVVCERPQDGHILVSVPPNIARRFISANFDDGNGEKEEARNLYRERVSIKPQIK